MEALKNYKNPDNWNYVIDFLRLNPGYHYGPLEERAYVPDSPPYQPNASPPYDPNSPPYVPNSPPEQSAAEGVAQAEISIPTETQSESNSTLTDITKLIEDQAKNEKSILTVIEDETEPEKETEVKKNIKLN